MSVAASRLLKFCTGFVAESQVLWFETRFHWNDIYFASFIFVQFSTIGLNFATQLHGFAFIWANFDLIFYNMHWITSK